MESTEILIQNLVSKNTQTYFSVHNLCKGDNICKFKNKQKGLNFSKHEKLSITVDGVHTPIHLT